MYVCLLEEKKSLPLISMTFLSIFCIYTLIFSHILALKDQKTKANKMASTPQVKSYC